MPGFCTPWPGNSSAIGPFRLINCLHPGHQARPPRQPRAEAGQQDVVATLDATLPDGFLQSERNRCAGRVAVLVRLADEDVDGEFEDVRADHVDVRGGVLGRICALVDVAAGDLRVAASVRAETPALESAAGRGRANDSGARTVTEDHRSAAVRIVEHP